MFCPQCSQEQISEDTRFCSRCGFLMTGISQLLANNGMFPQMLSPTTALDIETPRKKGIKQGGKLMIFGLILVPLITFLSIALSIGPFLAILTAILTFWGGLLRIIYAAVFESNKTGGTTLEDDIQSDAKKFFGRKKKTDALPLHETYSDSEYIPPMQMNWRDTNDLARTSVTEETTKLFQKDK